MIWIFLLIWLFITSLIAAGPQEELFLQANALYQKGEFALALEMFSTIEPKQSAIWYNMGNCAYHCDNIAQAFIYWKKAERNASGRLKHLIDKNIDVCLEKLGMQKQESLLIKLWQHVYTMLSKIPVGIIQVLFLLLWYVILVLIGIRRKNSFVVNSVLGCLLLGVSALVLVRYQSEHTLKGIVCKNEAALYVGPDDRYHKIGTLSHLDNVCIYQQVGSWCKVGNQLYTGWTPADSIELV